MRRERWEGGRDADTLGCIAGRAPCHQALPLGSTRIPAGSRRRRRRLVRPLQKPLPCTGSARDTAGTLAPRGSAPPAFRTCPGARAWVRTAGMRHSTWKAFVGMGGECKMGACGVIRDGLWGARMLQARCTCAGPNAAPAPTCAPPPRTLPAASSSAPAGTAQRGCQATPAKLLRRVH